MSSNNLYPCIPEPYKTALIIGQDYYSISNYSTVMDHHIFGTMSYTALRSPSSGNLGGLRYPVNYGSGEVSFDKFFSMLEYCIIS